MSSWPGIIYLASCMQKITYFVFRWNILLHIHIYSIYTYICRIFDYSWHCPDGIEHTLYTVLTIIVFFIVWMGIYLNCSFDWSVVFHCKSWHRLDVTGPDRLNTGLFLESLFPSDILPSQGTCSAMPSYINNNDVKHILSCFGFFWMHFNTNVILFVRFFCLPCWIL